MQVVSIQFWIAGSQRIAFLKRVYFVSFNKVSQPTACYHRVTAKWKACIKIVKPQKAINYLLSIPSNVITVVKARCVEGGSCCWEKLSSYNSWRPWQWWEERAFDFFLSAIFSPLFFFGNPFHWGLYLNPGWLERSHPPAEQFWIAFTQLPNWQKTARWELFFCQVFDT